MKNSIRIAGAYVGLIVGAGFASGQEVLQFFTHFGLWSIAGVVIATLFFAFLGMHITQLGSQLQTTSHKKVIEHLCGPYLGKVVDFAILFFLFGVAVVMVAGAGSVFQQQFGVSTLIGSIVMTILIIATLLLNIKRIIDIIGLVTPFLLLIVIIIAGYSIATMDASFSDLQAYASVESAASSNWVLGALLYVSYNIAAGIAMLTVMGGTVKDEKTAGMGGILGGLGLGLLLLLINIGMLSHLDSLQEVEMPTLFLANQISPALGWFLSIVLLGMIYNTAVGMLYAFTARVVSPDSQMFKLSVVIFGALAFLASFVGFITLVGTVYPLMGYLGFVLIAAIIISWLRAKQRKNQGQNVGLNS
ncbi:YkvI family membrane protein [Halalkalibacterium ligniniphilum]|uniref:YkvI family membrane protein n=1 Tax=Halalkalibacterium ligniniphilum TaxID=1134413 RepID=UPI0003494DDE|nr:hypothetical protein [Halalkalibacterium ligniniphilum]